MAVYKCKMCGAQIEVEKGSTVATCAYCGSKQTVANADDERKENLFNRANMLRANCEFDKALLAYQSILAIFPNEPEAHWGITLCRYGIEYVDDPATETKKPTIHRVSYESILKDSDYLAALSYADVIARDVYQEQAQEIADIQKNLLAISQKEEPFDIFICYKETDENGRRTPDSVLAQDIYTALTDRGYKVFFARITLENKLGTMYEPYIFAALNSAKIMLAIGTKKSYFEAVWVKNEWSRYLDLMKNRPDRYLIPCFKDMDPYEMPEEFMALQAQDLSKLGFLQDLTRGIDKITGRDTIREVQQAKVIQTDVNVGALLTRAEILIEDKNYEKADALLERVLNNDPKNSQAYLLKLVIELHLTSVDELKTQSSSLAENGNFRKAFDFGDAAQRSRLTAINEAIEKRGEEERFERIYGVALDYKESGEYAQAEEAFSSIARYRDAAAQAAECVKLGKQGIYNRAILMKERCEYEEAIENFEKIEDFKDSKQQIDECVELKNKLIYKRACGLRDYGKFDGLTTNFDEAIRLFASIPDYLDSKAQAEICAQLKEETNREAIYRACLFNGEINPRTDEGRLRSACYDLAKIPGYKDADQLLIQYTEILKEYDAHLAVENEKAAKRKARKKKIIAAFSITGVLGTMVGLMLTFLVFVPEGKQNNARELINTGRYNEAITVLSQNGSYGETNKLKQIAYAGKSFENRDYESGIDYIYNVGGTIDVTYDAAGGHASSSSQTIKRKRTQYIDNKADKPGYSFYGWVLGSYSVNANDCYAKITLKAQYRPIAYWLYYELDGGKANGLPESYYIDSYLTLPNPTKLGYTFLGWTTLGLDEPQKDYALPSGSTGDKTFVAHWKANEYKIHLDAAGGTVSAPEINVVFGQPYELPIPDYAGRSFQGWHDSNSVQYSNGIYSLTEDLQLTAKWEIVDYSITYVLNGGTNNPSNPSSYTVRDRVTFADPSKAGIEFLGWFDNDGNKIAAIAPGTTTGPLTLTAYWNDEFIVTLDPNGGSVSETSVNVQYGHPYSLPTPSRLGYEFDGWYDGSTKVGSTGTWEFPSSKALVAHWTIINNPINYALNGGTNDPSNPSSYTIEDSVTFADPSKTGYEFSGWFNGENAITGISVGNTGAVDVEAKWTANKNSLSVTSEDTSKGTVAISSGSGYSGESITVVATPADDWCFMGWYSESTMVSNNATYTFAMPTKDYSLVARFWTKEEKKYATKPFVSADGKTITYGLYPQKNVDLPSLVSALDTLTTPESNGWYLYEGEYYAKVTANPYGYYLDCAFDSGTKIARGTTYWFKCEPIVWNVLSNDGDEYHIASSVLLDAHRFHNSQSTRTIEGQTVYANNYKYSDIRTWLNDDFYNSAFAIGDGYIQTTTVDNSAATTDSSSNKYACANTEDKIFLLSYQESLTSYMPCRTTDWGRARGAYYSTSNDPYQFNGYYWTRSPGSPNVASSQYAWDINFQGTLKLALVDSSSFSVRPALTIKIS